MVAKGNGKFDIQIMTSMSETLLIGHKTTINQLFGGPLPVVELTIGIAKVIWGNLIETFSLGHNYYIFCFTDFFSAKMSIGQ